MSAAFEEEWDVECDHGRALLPRVGEKRLLCLPDHRMHDCFQLAAGIGIAEDRGAKLRAVYAVRSGRTRKRGLDRRERSAVRALQPVHLCIGVEHGHTLAPQHCRNRGFSHANRTGETKDDHCVSKSFSSSSVPSGGTAPKKSEKAIAAWPISISSPSTVASPRASAS